MGMSSLRSHVLAQLVAKGDRMHAVSVSYSSEDTESDDEDDDDDVSQFDEVDFSSDSSDDEEADNVESSRTIFAAGITRTNTDTIMTTIKTNRHNCYYTTTTHQGQK